MTNSENGGVCHWCHGDCGGTCLQLTASTQMKTHDPAYWMLSSEHTTTKTAHSDSCYICNDVEYAQMGLSLCTYCGTCTTNEGHPAGHIPADDIECTICGAVSDEYTAAMERVSKETG